MEPRREPPYVVSLHAVDDDDGDNGDSDDGDDDHDGNHKNDYDDDYDNGDDDNVDGCLIPASPGEDRAQDRGLEWFRRPG